MIYAKPQFKSGATSFYVVAISTLILVILATSFATAIMAEIIRSANDDLAQSAYDSALAGVEEAKLAYANYQNCVNRGFVGEEPNKDGEISCPEIIYWMEHPDCDMVAHILGRIKDDEEGKEINLEETATGKTSDLDQAYTCVEIDTNPQDIYGSLGLSTPYKIINVNSKLAPLISTIVLKWHVNSGDDQGTFANIDVSNQNVYFSPISKMGVLPIPAVVSFQIIQTSTDGFTFSQLSGVSTGNKSNRTTLYFVPTDNIDEIATKSSNTFTGIYDNKDKNTNYLSAAQVAASNNQSKNVPYAVYCDTDISEDFACSVDIDLPSLIGGEERSDTTFSFVLSLPYGGPSTNYSIGYICDGGACNFSNNYEDVNSINQIVIDSTGRAGDMYKRVEVRLGTETSSTTSGYPFYAIQANTIGKNISVDNEWGLENVPEPAPEPEPETIGCTENTQYMQDWNGANTLTTGRIIYLKDKRDEQCYSISKLKDGKVWMTTNLNLAGGTQLSSNDTDMDASYTLPTSLGFQSSNRLPASATSGYTSDTQAFLYNTGNTTNCYDAENQKVDQTCYSYYSWPAVTLGSGQNISTNDTAPYSICPKGWRLPTQTYRATAGGAGEFYNLAASYGLTFDFDEAGVPVSTNGNFFNAAGNGTVANFILSGYYYPGEYTNYNLNITDDYTGYLWSATAHTCSDGDGVNTGTIMDFHSKGSVKTGDHYFEIQNAPRILLPVRCIKR